MNRQTIEPKTPEKTDPVVPANSVQVPGLAGARLAKTFRALRHRNYRLFWTGQLISLTGTWMQSIAQGWLVYLLTKSALSLGVVSFSQFLPVLLFTLLGGVAADRFDRHRLVLFTQSASLLQAALLATLTLSGVIQVWHVIALAFLLGTINALDTPARQSLIHELVSKEDLMNAIALNSTAFNGTRIVGPAIAGTLLGALSAWIQAQFALPSESATRIAIGVCFALNALSYLGVIVGLLLMERQPHSENTNHESVWRSLWAGLDYARRDERVLALLSLMGVSSVFGFSYVTLMPLYAGEILQVGPQGYGFLMAAAGVGALSGALILASLGNYQRKGLLLTVGNFVFPVMLLVFAQSKVFPLSLVALVGFGWGLITQNALTNTLLQTIVPGELRGRILSLYTLMFMGMLPFGSLQVGAMAERFGAPVALSLGALICLSFALFVWWRWPHVRALR
ncbi:MAG: MFS transporter [Candidatus Bipolaricaulota bacterium]|nr:MFS transporter [Candidatus Bipolaricaulota bacterium]MCS7275140.1 MFS transporter [Candidatus Bipolaricaulota bacterium]MDW8111592.1 MFS transporter [Candidatus Bipolaricaulota bacterium]